MATIPSELPATCLTGQIQTSCGESVYPISVLAELVAVDNGTLKDSTTGGLLIPKPPRPTVTEEPDDVEDLSVACWTTPECLWLTDSIDGEALWKITVTACGGRTVFQESLPITADLLAMLEPDEESGCYDACQLADLVATQTACPPGVLELTQPWGDFESGDPAVFPLQTETSEFATLGAAYSIDCDNCLAMVDPTTPVVIRFAFDHAVTGAGHLGFITSSPQGVVVGSSDGNISGNSVGTIQQPAPNSGSIAWVEYQYSLGDLCTEIGIVAGGIGASNGTETINAAPTVTAITPLAGLCGDCN